LFSAVAALSLAIGIGAITAIFSVIYALRLKPPPGIAQPVRAVEIGRTVCAPAGQGVREQLGQKVQHGDGQSEIIVKRPKATSRVAAGPP
jgi:hypothetical protein